MCWDFKCKATFWKGSICLCRQENPFVTILNCYTHIARDSVQAVNSWSSLESHYFHLSAWHLTVGPPDQTMRLAPGLAAWNQTSEGARADGGGQLPGTLRHSSKWHVSNSPFLRTPLPSKHKQLYSLEHVKYSFRDALQLLLAEERVQLCRDASILHVSRIFSEGVYRWHPLIHSLIFTIPLLPDPCSSLSELTQKEF